MNFLPGVRPVISSLAIESREQTDEGNSKQCQSFFPHSFLFSPMLFFSSLRMIFRSLGVLSLILLKLKAINWSPVLAEDDVITIVNNAFSYPSEANTVQITVKIYKQ